MASISSPVPSTLEDAIRLVASEQGFIDDFHLEIKPSGDPDDVLSSAYKVKLESNDDKRLSLFVKCLQQGKDSEFVSESRIFFRNEVVFYGELLVEFSKLESRNFDAKTVTFKAAPKCFKTYHSVTLSYIIMEDLFHQNYLPLSPTKPVSLPEAHLALTELAKLHALSFVLRDRHPSQFTCIVSKMKETLFQEETRSTFGRMFVYAIHDALKLAKYSLPPGSVYVDKLAGFTLNVFDEMMRLAGGVENTEDEEYRVVTHGDFRSGNMLVKYSDGSNRPEKMCLLDFQACRYASPVHDLAFFLLVSLDKATRDQHLKDLTDVYHSTLCTTIQSFGSDPLRLFPRTALDKQLASHGRFALGLALAGLPLYLDEGRGAGGGSNEREDTPTRAEVGGVVNAALEANARKSMKCKNKIMEVIIDAVDLGWM